MSEQVTLVEARAKRVMWKKQSSDQCEQKSDRTSKWPSTYIAILTVVLNHSEVVIITCGFFGHMHGTL